MHANIAKLRLLLFFCVRVFLFLFVFLFLIHDRIFTLSHQPLNRDGRLGTTDDLSTSFLHCSLFSTALWDLANSRPVHSLVFSSHLFLCLPCLFTPFPLPWMVLDCWMANPIDPVLSHHTSQERQPAAMPELPNNKPHQSPKQSHAEGHTE